MATQPQKNQENSEFSFFNEEEKIQRELAKSNRRSFITKITLGASAVALTAYGAQYGVTEWMESKRLAKEKEVKDTAEAFKNNNLVAYLQNYKKTIDAQYSKNATDLLEFAKHKDIITAFNLKMNYGLLEKNNNQTYSNALNHYKTILDDFQKIIKASENNNLLKEFIEDNKSMALVYKVAPFVKGGVYKEGSAPFAEAIRSTDLNTASQNLVTLNKEINGELNNVLGIKEEMMATIMAKISSGDYNLNATQKALTNDILDNTNSELKELASVRQELKGTEFEKEFGDKDLAEAKQSLEALEHSFIDRIAEDKQSIEKMIAKVSNGETLQPGDAGAAASAASPLVSNNTTSSGGGWGAFEYYLLYSWLSGGSRSTPAMAASHTSSFAATSGKNLKRENGNYVAPIMANTAGAKQLASAGSSSGSLYNSRSPNSYLSKSVPQRASTSNTSRITPLQAKQKIEAIKSRGRQATQARKASIARAQAAKAQAQARSSARSSSSSRSSFSGGRGGGGGG